MQRERERKPVEVEVFKPKSYKKLVDWFVLQVESGTATKRDFVRLAVGLANPPKKVAPKKAPPKKPAGKSISVDDLKADGGDPVKK